VTEHEAYLAMFAFLETHYRRGPSDDIGALLGALSLLPDGSPADAAMTGDWREACKAATEGRVDAAMRLYSQPD
jgi:hypothetical protein